MEEQKRIVSLEAETTVSTQTQPEEEQYSLADQYRMIRQRQMLIMSMIDFVGYKREPLTLKQWERKRKARKQANASRKANRNK